MAQSNIEQDTQNATNVERFEKSKYKIPIFTDRTTDLDKTDPKMWWEQIQQYIELTYERELEQTTSGESENDVQIQSKIKADLSWSLGPKAKFEIMRGQWGREFKDLTLEETITLFKKIFIPARNTFHSRGQFFNAKQEQNETMDEYWKKLVEIERKCEFNTITPEEIITYKFATSIRDKKAMEKFIKGPLNLETVQRTIEIDNYNRKYGEKYKKKDTDGSEDETIAFTNRKDQKVRKNWKRDNNKKSCYHCGRENWSPKHICPAVKAKCKSCEKYGHFAKVCKTKPIHGIDKYQSESDEWPEVDHISIG